MSFPSFFRWLHPYPRYSRSRRAVSRPKRASFRPHIDILEDRKLLSTITDLGALFAEGSSVGKLVNSSGQVVGDSQDNFVQGFFYDGSQMTILDPFGSGESQAFGLNDSGEVVGYGLLADTYAEHAFLWDSTTGNFTDLTNLAGAELGFAGGINDSSQVVGWSNSGGPSRATFWDTDGTATDLGALTGYQISSGLAINDSGQVVIDAVDPGITDHTLLYDGSTMTDLGSDVHGIGINDSGQVVGWASNGRGIIWDSVQGLQYLAPVGGYASSTAAGINNLSQAVGESVRVAGHVRFFHATLWSDGSALDLNDFLPTGSGWALEHAYGINDNDLIVGSGVINGASHAFLLNLNDGSPGAPSHCPRKSAIDPALFGFQPGRSDPFLTDIESQASCAQRLSSSALSGNQAAETALMPAQVDRAFSEHPAITRVLSGVARETRWREVLSPDTAIALAISASDR